MDTSDEPRAEPAQPATDQVTVVGALAEPTRRSLYEYVASSDDWVSRDHACGAVAVGRATAAHHLDRLVDAGLLEVDYRRVSERTGPGAGRPAKLYRRTPRDFAVNLPPRDYELAGQLLARAVDAASTDGTGVGVGVVSAVQDAATVEGERLAEAMQDRAGPETPTDTDRRLQIALEVLTEQGYEPAQVDESKVVLRNCPFHRLAQDHTDLVCGMNVHLLRAAVDGFGGTGFSAEFEPQDGQCCVTLRRPG